MLSYESNEAICLREKALLRVLTNKKLAEPTHLCRAMQCKSFLTETDYRLQSTQLKNLKRIISKELETIYVAET
jgi:hypothetical protein